jgi:hypothetical protein
METKRIPFDLVKRLSGADAAEARQWWEKLSQQEQRGVSGAAGRVRLLARYVEPDSMVELEEDIADINEYREENGLIWRQKVHHVCVAHPAARDAVRRGHLHASFQCPLANAACPMRAILDEEPGRDVRFRLAPPTDAPSGGAHG